MSDVVVNTDRLSFYTTPESARADAVVIRAYRQTNDGALPSVTSVTMGADTVRKLAADLAARVGYKIVPANADAEDDAEDDADAEAEAEAEEYPARPAGEAGRARKLAADLEGAFVWSATPQGHDYWRGVTEALFETAEHFEQQAARSAKASALRAEVAELERAMDDKRKALAALQLP